jgi:predicted AlkP superfamily pyrophosphatase or phosphodiesterase
MKKLLFLILLLFISCGFNCTSSASSCEVKTKIKSVDQNRPYVILISMDGFRYDYFEKTETPNLDKFIASGVKANSLKSAFPTKTFPNHYSIVTGMRPGKHGLIDNFMWDTAFDEHYTMGNRNAVQNKKWYDGEPIWITAQKNGIKTASMFWVGSEVREKNPDYFKDYDGQISNDARVDQVIDWLNFEESKRPHFITLYFSDTDEAGHKYGTESKEIIDAIKEMDRVFGYLEKRLAKLPIRDKIQIILVSDHGMVDIDENKYVYIDSLNTEGASRLIGRTTMLNVYTDNPDKLRKQLEGHKLYTIYTEKELSEKFGYDYPKRTANLILLGKEGVKFIDKRSRPVAGMHGYHPDLPSMQGIFVASGSKFKKNLKIDTFDNIHIYPIISKIFGFKVPKSVEGTDEVAKKVLN